MSALWSTASKVKHTDDSDKVKPSVATMVAAVILLMWMWAFKTNNDHLK